MEVKVKRPDGTSFKSHVLPSDTVKHLEEVVALRFKIENKEYEGLKVFSASALTTGTLEENRITNGTTILVDDGTDKEKLCQDPLHDAFYAANLKDLKDKATVEVEKGGVGLLIDGAAFSVRAGSAKAATVSMSIAPSGVIPSFKVHDDVEGGTVNSIYYLEPHGTEFTKPVLLALPYNSATPVERLGVFHIQIDGAGQPVGTWKYIPGARFDGFKALVNTSHFSAFAVFDFADVNKQRTATLTRTTNAWEAVSPGLIYRGTCGNPTCPQSGKVVNSIRGFGRFDISTDRLNAKCPVCGTPFVPDKFVIYNTDANVKYTKTDGTTGDNNYNVPSWEVRAFGIDSFGTAGTAEYKELIVTTKPGPGSSYKIDVCFALDCTMSMDPYIAAGKTQITNIARGLENDLKTKSLNSKLRLAFVAYRDYPDASGSRPPHLLQVYNFTEDVESIVNSVSSQKTVTNTDYPEHVVGALKSAADMKWEGSTRVFVLIGDAPCHGQTYHTYRGAPPNGDTFPGGDPLGDPAPLLENFVKNEVNFIFMKINDTTNTMIAQFRAQYDAHPANVKKLKIDELNLGTNPDIMGKLVLDTVMRKINDLFI